MRRFVTFAVILFVVACAPSVLAGKGDPAKGKALYASKCATCHAAGGEGKPAIGKMMKVELRHLGAKEVQAKSDAQLGEVVTKGTGKMKPVSGLKESDVADLVAFLRTLAKK